MKEGYREMLNLFLLLGFIFGSFVLAGCGEEEIQLKPGPKLTRVINNFESVEDGLHKEQQLTAEEVARKKAIEDEYTKMMSPSQVVESESKKLALVPSQNVIEGGQRAGSIRFEGDVFSIDGLKEISLEIESKKTGKTYYLDSVTSLWKIDGSTLVFELPEHQRPSYVEPISIAPIVVRTENFILNEGETIKTDGRSLKIIASRVEINGSIITTPLSTYSDSENGRDAGNLDVISTYSSFGPNHVLDVRGGSAGKLACADTVLQKRGQQALVQVERNLFKEYFSFDITAYPGVVSVQEVFDSPPFVEKADAFFNLSEHVYERNSYLQGAWGPKDIINLMLLEYAVLWESKKNLGGTDENEFEGRIYKEEYFVLARDRTDSDGKQLADLQRENLKFLFDSGNSTDQRVSHLKSNWSSFFKIGWESVLSKGINLYNDRNKGNSAGSNTDMFTIADNRVTLSSSFRKIRPVKKDPSAKIVLYEEPLVVEGFRPGGNSGQVRIYSGLSFILPPSNILFDAGQDTVRERLDWRDYQDQVYGDREISLYEDFQYMLSMQTWKNWSDKVYGPLFQMDDWGSFGKWNYDSVKFEVEEDPALPESVMTCEIADDVFRGEARLPLRMENQMVFLPERVMEVGLSLEDVPESFKRASELQGQQDPARKALNALKASKAGE